ncbi:MAG: hypothetical protein WD768_08145 [Phycisphaeraceae bacterium]
MNRKSLGALVALNGVLLIALIMVAMLPARPAQAQFGGVAFVMIAGEVTGQARFNCVYITELSSARMVAIMFNSANDKLEKLAGRELKNDVKGDAAPKRGR